MQIFHQHRPDHLRKAHDSAAVQRHGNDEQIDSEGVDHRPCQCPEITVNLIPFPVLLDFLKFLRRMLHIRILLLFTGPGSRFSGSLASGYILVFIIPRLRRFCTHF